MPIKHAIWKVGQTPEPLAASILTSEGVLEDMIVARPDILSPDWMLIGRQEITDRAGRIDLLAVARDASLVLIELKRNQTPRDVIAQAIDYASWVDALNPDEINAIYGRYSGGRTLKVDFCARFGYELDEESLNETHQIVVVASSLDPSTERIVQYLDARKLAINVLFFQVFQSGGEQWLSRTWLVEPIEPALESSTATRGSSPRPATRQWDEAAYFAEFESKSGSKLALTARQLLDWSKANTTRIWWGAGKHKGSFVPVIETDATKQLLFAAFTGGPKAKPVVQLYCGYWAKHPPFESPASRLEILRRLNEIPGIALTEAAIDKWPSVPLEALAREGAITKFLGAMEWFVAEVRKSTPSTQC